VSLLGAAGTINGYRALANKRLLSIAAMMSGLLATELPMQTAAVQACGLAMASRWTDRRIVSAPYVLTAASCLGLFWLRRAAHGADATLTTALDEALGHCAPTESTDRWQEDTTGAAETKTPGLLRMARVGRDFIEHGDVSYGVHGHANLLDIWRRPDAQRHGSAPVLLQIPGGAWATGNKRGQAHPLMSHLTNRGWVCVSINYRLSPSHRWPAHIIDVKQAIAWTKENIANYGGDPSFIAVTGGSAGGHLASLTALTPNMPQFQPGFEDADTALQAAVPFYGVYDFTRRDGALHPMMVPFLERMVLKSRRDDNPSAFAAASSITYVGAHAPAFFVLHGRNDSFIPVEQARAFVHQLRSATEQPVAYAELPYAQHAFDIFGSPRATHAAVAVERFLTEIRCRHQG
jgi:acetyl esterase/lipase